MYNSYNKFRLNFVNNIYLYLLSIFSFPLIFAYSSQYLLDLHPCRLCVFQRIGFFVAIFLVLLSRFVYYNNNVHKILFGGIILILISIIIIAGYQVCLEQGLFELSAICTSTDQINYNTLEELRFSLLLNENPSCDTAEFEFFGISMAGLNIFYTLFAIFVTYTGYNNIIIKNKNKNKN